MRLNSRMAANGSGNGWVVKTTAVRLPALDLFLEPSHSLGIDAVTGSRPLDFAADQAGLAQHFQVLADRRLRQGSGLDNFVGHAGLARRQGNRIRCHCEPPVLFPAVKQSQRWGTASLLHSWQ
jgi:hypothetical protein